MNKLTLCIFVFLLSMQSCNNDSDEIYLYYPGGQLEKIITTKANKWQGCVRTYSKEGQLNSLSYWNNNLQDGPAYFHYPNGCLKEVSYWSKNKQHGYATAYYANGIMKSKYLFRQGKAVGYASIYDSTGKLDSKEFFLSTGETEKVIYYDAKGHPSELQVYDGHGQIIRVTRYDKLGHPNPGGWVPFLCAKDTISWGEAFSGYVKFSYPVRNATLIVGHMTKNLKLLDTLAVIKPDSEGKFNFLYKPKKIKDNIFSYQIIYSVGEGDAMTTIKTGEFHAFFVRPSIH